MLGSGAQSVKGVMRHSDDDELTLLLLAAFSFAALGSLAGGGLLLGHFRGFVSLLIGLDEDDKVSMRHTSSSARLFASMSRSCSVARQ